MFIGVSVIAPDPLAVTDAGLTVPLMLLVQVNVLPPGVGTGVNDSVDPLQIVVVAGRLENDGGVVTVTVNADLERLSQLAPVLTPAA